MSNNQELIEKIKNNDPKALHEFYNNNKTGFLLFFNRYNLNADDALDIYQDAIIALVENIKKGKIDSLQSSLTTYLFGIGKFMVFQKFKKEKRTIPTEDFKNLEYEEEEVEEEISIQIQLLQKAFDKIGEQCKKVLQLFYYEEKKLDEIQIELGYSNKDVLKSQKSRCLKQLKDLANEK
mgnify:FL=1